MNIDFQYLADHNLLFLYLHQGHYLNPLVPQQKEVLANGGFFEDPSHQTVFNFFTNTLSDLSPASYFPTPILRALAHGESLSLALVKKYSYPHIRVDQSQNWFLQEKCLDSRIKNFFLTHLAYESTIDRYYVEYLVEQRWDKCYLDCAITPVLGIGIQIQKSPFTEIQLNNGKSDHLCLETFQLDAAERLFCQTQKHGNALLADGPRVALLQTLDDSGTALTIGGKHYKIQRTS